MLILFLLNSVVLVSSFIFIYRVLRLASNIDSLISLFIIYFAQVVLSILTLGIIGRLSLFNLVLVNLIILLAVYFFSYRAKSNFYWQQIGQDFYGILSNKVVLLALVFILGFGITKICFNLVNPPFGWDDLNYHFTFPIEWLKHNNLVNPITICDDPAPSYYPINGSLFFLWLIFPLKNVFLADLGQLPFFILAFLSVFSLAKKLSFDSELAFIASALFVLIPNFFKQLQIAYVDVMVAGLFLAGLNYLFVLRDNPSWRNILLFAVSLGLFVGTKTIALPYAVLLFIPFMYFYVKNLKKYALSLILLILVVIALGGFTYIRNFIETGNPLYPIDVKIFGKFIFKGVIDTAVYKAHFKLEDYSFAKLLFHEGLGLQTLIFIVPGTFLALIVAWIRKKKTLDFYCAYLLALPVLIYLIYRYIIPLANSRYLYALFGVGIIAGFYFWREIKIPRFIIGIVAVFCILSSAAQLAKRQELVIGFIVSLSLLFLLPALLKYLRRPRNMAILVLVVVLSLFILEKEYVKNEYKGYIKMVKYSGFWPDATRAWDWLNTNTTGNNIAYVGRPVPFPLYGTNFKNNVYYVSVNATDPAKLHYFADSRYVWGYDYLSQHKSLEEKNNYRGGADYSVWRANLLRRNTDYLFVYSLHQTNNIIFPLEDGWAQNNPLKFSPVFSNNTVHIYKILK